MTDMVARLDDWGTPAWIGVMVLGFVIFWPIGLAILAYMLWSGRMGCRARRNASNWQQRVAGKWERKMERWGMQAKAFTPTGNRAFDEYREETLSRLQEEAHEFQSFLDRLRMAKDKGEFEQFMTERRNRPATSESAQSGQTDTGPSGGAPTPA